MIDLRAQRFSSLGKTQPVKMNHGDFGGTAALNATLGEDSTSGGVGRPTKRCATYALVQTENAHRVLAHFKQETK